MNELSPAIIDLIQNAFSSKVNEALSTVGQFSTNLLYIFAAIELVIFGIAWTFKRDQAFGELFIKVIKIALILFIVTNYIPILNVLAEGFRFIGLKATSEDALQLLIQPVKVWQYGFDAAISLLNISLKYGSLNTGASFLYLSLGLGSLICFTLIGAQIVFAVIAFYIVALVGLIVLPISVFTPAGNMFNRALQHLFMAGIRILTILLTIGVAISVWSSFNVQQGFEQSTNLVEPLGLFFSALIFLVLSIRLPEIAVNAVGSIAGTLFNDNSVAVTVNPPVATPVTSTTVDVRSPVASVAAATAVPAGIAANQTTLETATTVSTQAASPANQSINVAAQIQGGAGGTSSTSGLKDTGRGLDSSTDVSVSQGSLKEIKQSFREALNESRNKDQ
jgi:type IV secretion system protein TrbL